VITRSPVGVEGGGTLEIEEDGDTIWGEELKDSLKDFTVCSVAAAGSTPAWSIRDLYCIYIIVLVI
jgi:hypothetical protein